MMCGSKATDPAFVVYKRKSVELGNKLWSSEIKGKGAGWISGAERIGMQ